MSNHEKALALTARWEAIFVSVAKVYGAEYARMAELNAHLFLLMEMAEATLQNTAESPDQCEENWTSLREAIMLVARDTNSRSGLELRELNKAIEAFKQVACDVAGGQG